MQKLYLKPVHQRAEIFLPGNDSAYLDWRSSKLADYPDAPADLLVQVRNAEAFSDVELKQIRANLRIANMALYELDQAGESKKELVCRNRQLGFKDLDGNLCSDEDNVTSIRMNQEGRHKFYIPYTNRRLVWHTDGYYNDSSSQIRGMALHCVHPAARGGESLLLDHELAYIHLRDADPAYIRALFEPDVLTIPPNIENGVEIRGARTGPVFSILENGALHMRYSARTRNIEWKEDGVTADAVTCLTEFLDSAECPAFRLRLESGQGLICNNVLHARTEFEDAADTESRLLYRARYYNRAVGT
jgi:alpha-ketoglutarate-dependent taurine dioxygenase